MNMTVQPEIVPQGTMTHNSDKISLTEIGEREREKYAKLILEALLFSSSEPLSLSKLKEIVENFHPFSAEKIRQLLCELGENYRLLGTSFQLFEIAEGYLLRTSEAFHPYVEKLQSVKRAEKLSRAAIEVMAIIAYRQPVTRGQIEGIRGVDCSAMLSSLLEKKLIVQVGKLEVAGRPPLYGTTSEFLNHFGLSNLEQLPKLSQPQP